MARKWKRQQALALAFDDLTAGAFASKVLPFIEQAQQKLFASKWCDGDATPPVRRRVSELARDINARTAALDARRRARHELLGPDGTARVGGVPVDEGGARALEKQYAECVSLCRSKRAVELQVAALAELGGLQLRAGAAGRAAESWVEAVDATFQTYDVVASWPSHIDGVVSTLGLAAVGRCIALLGQLAAQTTRVQLEQRMQYALFASALATALFGGSLPHPARPIDYAGYRLKELWPAQPVFDDAAFGELRLLDGLNATAHALLEYDQPLPALPLLVLYKFLSVERARDVPHAAAADALAVRALSDLGQVNAALTTLDVALRGADLPADALQPRRRRSSTARRRRRRRHRRRLPTTCPPTPTRIRRRCAPSGAQPAAHAAKLYGPLLCRLLTLARARLLLRLCERLPPEDVLANGAKGKKGAPPAAATGGGVSSDELLAAAEEALASVETDVAAELDAEGEGEAEGEGALSAGRQQALVALWCEAATRDGALPPRPRHRGGRRAEGGDGPRRARAGGGAGGGGGASARVPAARLPGWLRLREYLVRLALQQGQLPPRRSSSNSASPGAGRQRHADQARAPPPPPPHPRRPRRGGGGGRRIRVVARHRRGRLAHRDLRRPRRRRTRRAAAARAHPQPPRLGVDGGAAGLGAAGGGARARARTQSGGPLPRRSDRPRAAIDREVGVLGAGGARRRGGERGRRRPRPAEQHLPPPAPRVAPSEAAARRLHAGGGAAAAQAQVAAGQPDQGRRGARRRGGGGGDGDAQCGARAPPQRAAAAAVGGRAPPLRARPAAPPPPPANSTRRREW